MMIIVKETEETKCTIYETSKDNTKRTPLFTIVVPPQAIVYDILDDALEDRPVEVTVRCEQTSKGGGQQHRGHGHCRLLRTLWMVQNYLQILLCLSSRVGRLKLSQKSLKLLTLGRSFLKENNQVVTLERNPNRYNGFALRSWG